MGKERFVDLIQKKKNGETLTKEEIDFMITDYVAGKIPDYQMSAMLMAIYFNGMENEELAALLWQCGIPEIWSICHRLKELKWTNIRRAVLATRQH